MPSISPALEKIWLEVQQKVSVSIDSTFFQIYCSQLTLFSFDNETVVIVAPTSSTKEIISSNLSIYEDAFYEISKKRLAIVVKWSKELVFDESQTPAAVPSSNINQNYTFDKIILGQNNKEALPALKAICDNLLSTPLIYIYGKPGVGKTSLLHATGNYYLSKNNKKTKVLYVNILDFIDDFTKSAAENNFNELNKKFRNIDMLLLDDIENLSGKNKTADFLYTILDRCLVRKIKLVVSSSLAISDLHGIHERIISRLSSGLFIKISRPDADTARLLVKDLISTNISSVIEIDEQVIDYIVQNTDRDIRAIQGAINRLSFYMDIYCAESMYLNLDTAKRALDNSIKLAKKKALSVTKILNVVSEYYEIPVNQIISTSRKANIATARQIAIYLCQNLLNCSYTLLGLEFNRDHSTIISSCQKISQLVIKDNSYAKAIKDLQKQLM